MKFQLNRRAALKSSLAVGAAVWTGTPAVADEESPNNKLNVAFIGVGGRGFANVNGLKNQNVVALCDVDQERGKRALGMFPKAKKFVDFRKMYDAIENEIDAVVISTPDHMHFHPAYRALEMGKHVYLEKPMAHNLWEIRTLTEMAKEKGVATQLGVQRHTIKNMHRVVELIQSGAIGRVNEVYSWISSSRGMPAPPTDKPKVPSHLDWDLWLGPAVARDYHSSICPYGWRFWWDYGTGETGNWGCHILDIPFWALGLKYPTKISGGGDPVDTLRSPKAMRSTFEFPAADGGKPIVLHWDQAAKGPDVLEKYDMPNKGNNTLFIGEEGMLLCGFGQRKLYPESKFADFEAPEQTIPDSPGFYKEFVTACRGGQAATCDFEYSGPLAETVLLGNLAYRTSSSFDWDAKALKPSDESALDMIREPYRKGWEM